MKKYKNLLSVIGFCICFLLLFTYMTSVLMPKWKGKNDNISRTITFYNQPENSIDVLIIGASSLRNGVSPLIMWKEKGFNSYVRATNAQDPMVSYFYLLESLKYQSPKVVILDGGTLFFDFGIDEKEPALRIAIDPLKPSITKLHLVFNIVSQSESQTIASYVFPFFRYHTRWKDLSEKDFLFFKTDKYNPFRGQHAVLDSEPFEIPEDFMISSTEATEPNERSLYYHQKIIDLCIEKGIEVMYLTFPRTEKSTYSEHLGIEKVAEENDMVFIDYALPDFYTEVGFDPQTDYYDPNHVNIYGAVKFSKHLGNFLDNQFDLPDRRNTPEADQWETDYNILIDSITNNSIVDDDDGEELE